MPADSITGVILEVAGSQGVDVVAAYANHCARSASASGATVTWQRSDESLDALIDAVLAAAPAACEGVPIVDANDRPAMRFGEARVSIVGADGLRAVQAPMLMLASNPRLAVVLRTAAALMRELAAKGP